MPDDTIQPITFPSKGVNVTTEYEEQAKETAVSSQNVRAFDFVGRQRGGSRPGLGRYIAEQSPEGSTLIQHLNVLVDPSLDAQGQNFETAESDWIEDPRTGLYVPPTGWGFPNGTDPPNQALALRQSFADGVNVVSVEQTFNFSSTTGTGTILIVGVVTLDDTDPNTTVAVKNGALHAYTQIGSYHRFTKLGLECSLSIWYRISADGSADEGQVRITPSSDCTIALGGMEWIGQNASPIGNHVNNADSQAHQTTGNVAVATTNEAVIGFFCGIISPDTATPDAGFTLSIDHGDGTLDNSDIQLFVVTKTANAIGNVNPGITLAGGADDFVAVALCIKD